jgi:MFS family permease
VNLPDEQANQRYNAKINTLNGLLKGAGSQLVNPFLGINAIRLGAPNIYLGVISAIPYIAGGFAALLSPWLVRQRHLKRTTFWLFLVARLSIVLFALIDHFDHLGHPALWFMAAIVWSNIPGALATLSWQSMTTKLFTGAMRSTAVMWRQWSMSGIGVAAVLLAGLAIDKNPSTHAYIVIYCLGAAFGLAEVAVYRLFRPGEEPLDRPESTWRSSLPKLRATPGFPRFVIASVVFYFGWLILWPATTRYQVSIDHATNGWIAIYTATNAVFTLVALPIWRRINYRRPTVTLLPWAAVLMCLTPAIYLFHPSLPAVELANVTGGLAGAGFNLLINVRLMELVPHDLRTMAVGANTVATGMAGGLGALTAVVVMHWGSIMGVFAAAALLRLVAGGLFVWASDRPRQMPFEATVTSSGQASS